MNIFKYLIKNAKRDWDFGDICYYAKMYRKIEIEEPIKITDNIYAVKYFNDLLFFVKKVSCYADLRKSIAFFCIRSAISLQ